MENEIEYTTDTLCTTLSSFLGGDNKKVFLSTEKENEILLPNIKIVQRIFLNGQKYKKLKGLGWKTVQFFDNKSEKFNLLPEW